MVVQTDGLLTNLDAEQALLGGLMLDNAMILDVAPIVAPTDFCRVAHRLIYEAIVKLHGAGHPVDPLTVYDELQRCDHLEELQRGDHGPEDYLRVLFEGCPTAAKRRLR